MLGTFTQAELIRLGIVIILAALPAVIWSVVIFRGRKTSRWPLLLAFFLGTLTVVPLIILYDYLWFKFPVLDLYRAIEQNITDLHFAAIATLMVVGMLEELAKSGVVRFIDKTKIGIQTINDAVKYSILAGLGFAFTENIFYFYNIWQGSDFFVLLSPMIFRSIFTVCAHMVFSGIFGYYFGIAKFAQPLMEARLWMGERSMGISILAKILGTDETHTFSQYTRLKGLLIAMTIHAAFNFFLEFGQFIPVIFIVGLGFIYLMYLLAHKTGAIVFASAGRVSSMAQRDVDTVLELLGMWSKEGRYKDVIDICQRLLLRDPDNKVVQLFQAKAMDKEKLDALEASVSSLFKQEENTKSISTSGLKNASSRSSSSVSSSPSSSSSAKNISLRTLVRQKVLMEMLREKQARMSAAVVQAAPEDLAVSEANALNDASSLNEASTLNGASSVVSSGTASRSRAHPTPKVPKIPGSPGAAP